MSRRSASTPLSGCALLGASALFALGCSDYQTTTPPTIDGIEFATWAPDPPRVVTRAELENGVATAVTITDRDEWPAAGPERDDAELLQITEQLSVVDGAAVRICATAATDRGQPASAAFQVLLQPPNQPPRRLFRSTQQTFPWVEVRPDSVVVGSEPRSDLTEASFGRALIEPIVAETADLGALAGPTGVERYRVTVGLCQP